MSEANAWFHIGRAYERIAFAKGMAQNRIPGFPMALETEDEKEKRIRITEDIAKETQAYTYALSIVRNAVDEAGR